MYWEHLKKTVKEEHLLQQIFYPDETRLKFKLKLGVVMAQYKMVYKNMQEKAKQSFESYTWILLPLNYGTVMRRITTFKSMTDRIYNGGPIIL